MLRFLLLLSAKKAKKVNFSTFFDVLRGRALIYPLTNRGFVPIFIVLINKVKSMPSKMGYRPLCRGFDLNGH